MNRKDKLRKIKALMYKHHETSRDYMITCYERINECDIKAHKEWVFGVKEIFKLCDELKFTDTEIDILWRHFTKQRNINHEVYTNKPPKEGRDNKAVHVGGGGSNRNMIRYPSKKRSLSTWKKFYKLFPWAAERDGFDGKSSSKMK